MSRTPRLPPLSNAKDSNDAAIQTVATTTLKQMALIHGKFPAYRTIQVGTRTALIYYAGKYGRDRITILGEDGVYMIPRIIAATDVLPEEYEKFLAQVTEQGCPDCEYVGVLDYSDGVCGYIGVPLGYTAFFSFLQASDNYAALLATNVSGETTL